MTEPIYALVGGAIRKRRELIPLTQGSLASKVGMARTSITNVESGRQSLTLHQLEAIANALDVSIVDLLPDKRPKINRAIPDPEFSKLLNRLSDNPRKKLGAAQNASPINRRKLK